jgi:hypothetical protein
MITMPLVLAFDGMITSDASAAASRRRIAIAALMPAV